MSLAEGWETLSPAFAEPRKADDMDLNVGS